MVHACFAVIREFLRDGIGNLSVSGDVFFLNVIDLHFLCTTPS